MKKPSFSMSEIKHQDRRLLQLVAEMLESQSRELLLIERMTRGILPGHVRAQYAILAKNLWYESRKITTELALQSNHHEG